MARLSWLLVALVLASISFLPSVAGTDYPAPFPSQLDSQGGGFVVAPGVTPTIDFLVPERGPVTLVFHLEHGAASEMAIATSSHCEGVLEIPRADPAEPSVLRFECGEMWPQNLSVTLSTLTGALQGYVRAEGADYIVD